MKDLIEALQIMSKYMDDNDCPTCCEHDELMVMCDPSDVSKEDIKRLKKLSFTPDDCYFRSYRFGSA